MPQTPSPLWRRTLAFLSMAFGLAVMGLGVGLLAAFVSGVALRRSAFGLAGLGVVMLVMMAGYLVGVIVGIIVTDKVVHHRGSIWLGVLGSIAGMGLAAGLAGLAEPLNLNLAPGLLFGSVFAAIPLLGAAGFRLHPGRLRAGRLRRKRSSRDGPAEGGTEVRTGGDGRI